MKFKTIASRIFALLVPTIIITTVSFALFSYYESNKRINATIDEKMHETLQAADLEIQLELYKNATIATNLAAYGRTLKIDTFSHSAHKGYLEEVIKSNKNTFGGGVWFEPYKFDRKSYYFAPFLYIDEYGNVSYTYEYSHYADYFSQDWYLKGKNSSGEVSWSKAYYDPYSTITMVTAVKAFYDTDGNFIGLGSADMNIENIRRIVNNISVGKTGRAFIIGSEGEYISFFDENKSVRQKIQNDSNAALSQLGKEILQNDSGNTSLLYKGKNHRVYYTTMANLNWTIAVMIDESEIQSSMLTSTVIMAIIPVLGLALVMLGIVAIVKYLRKIINKVNAVADLASLGDFSARIAVTEDDEFGFMEQRLNKMISNLNTISTSSAQLLTLAENREKLLHTVNNVASMLLQSEVEEFENTLWQCMGMVAESVRADRMYIWKNYIKDEKTYCTQLYEWSEGAEPQQGGKYTVDIPYPANSPEWVEKLPNGKCINSLVRDTSPQVREHLAAQGILSILIVPVFLREKFWGFVGFDDCHSERLFSESEETILHSVSLLFANALLRNEMTLDIQAASEAAQAGSRAKSNFLSNMSHEIRTPMNAIIGMAAIGKSASDTEKKNYALEKIEDASNHLLGVINDILDMSKIEANKLELAELEFDFEKLLQRAVNFISFRVDEKKQNFSVFIDNNLPKTLIGDDHRLTQVITNLLSNAVKFTPEQGALRLDARLVNSDNGVCLIQIEITDTGIGISPERISQIFDSFEQADVNTTRQYGGTGLGLSISKHIIELMGGNIWVESELGKGSKFIFNIRAKRGKEKSFYQALSDISRDNIRVLVVDDEDEIREYFKIIAEQFAIACDTIADGREALKLIDNNKGSYNIYFIDFNMPGMTGIELSREIKSRNLNKPVIIMVSTIEWSIIEKEATFAGVARFLPKPLFPYAIADCIKECLGQQNIQELKNNPDEKISFKGYHVLLAEDIEVNQEIVKAVLGPTKIGISCAANGIEAVRMFSQMPELYDMVLMDVQMPLMDGLEATRNIRALGFQKAKEIPIIAMTADVFREDVEKCRAAGMNDHIGKPLDIDEMLSKITHYLKPRK